MMKLSSPGEAFPTDNETEASAALTTKVNFQCLKSFFFCIGFCMKIGEISIN